MEKIDNEIHVETAKRQPKINPKTGKELRKSVPRPKSKENIQKALKVRQEKLQKARDELDLKRLLELQQKKMDELKLFQSQTSQPLQPSQPPPRSSTSRQIVIDDNSSESSSDNEEEIVYVPAKTKSRRSMSSYETTSRKSVIEVEHLKKEIDDLKKQMSNQETVQPIPTPLPSPVVEKPVEKPVESEYDRLQKSSVDFMKYNILKF